MKMFYRKALMKDGFDEESEMYKKVNRIFDRDIKKYARDRKRRAKFGITFNRLSAFECEGDGNKYECFASDEDVEETILHEMELERLRECLELIPKEDKELLLRFYGGDHGELKRIAEERGVNYKNLSKKVQRLLKKLRHMMSDECH